MIIDNVKISASGFNPCRDELSEYVRYVTNILVTLEDDGFVNVEWTSHNPTFERVRRITGSEIAACRQAV